MDSSQAQFNRDQIAVVDDQLIATLKQNALQSPTRRFRLCLHHSPADLVQEMIIVHCRDNYSRPHSHPGLASTCVIIEGELSVFVFDEHGATTRRIDMGPAASGKPHCLRLGGDVWHMPVCTTPQVVFFENMQGPFDRDQVNLWAPWSPAEDDLAGIQELRRRLGIDRD